MPPIIPEPSADDLAAARAFLREGGLQAKPSAIGGEASSIGLKGRMEARRANGNGTHKVKEIAQTVEPEAPSVGPSIPHSFTINSPGETTMSSSTLPAAEPSPVETSGL